MKARVIINDKANDGNYSRSFLVKLARMGASIMAYPESGSDGEPVDMDTSDGFDFIRNYNGR
jgi:hypothetical protein